MRSLLGLHVALVCLVLNVPRVRAQSSDGMSGADAPAGAPGRGAVPAAPPAAAAVAPSGTASPPKTGTAETGNPGTRPRPFADRRPSLSHDLQFGFAVLIGSGYRAIVPYESDIVCGDAKEEGARVCTSRAPFFIDLQPSFGLSTSWDALVDVRVGLETDFNTKRPFVIAPGFRYWLDPEGHVKFFSTFQLAYDVTDSNDPRVRRSDLAFRNSNGVMIEVMRNFGVYLQFGETIGFVRWLSFLVDAGIGVQARVP